MGSKRRLVFFVVEGNSSLPIQNLEEKHIITILIKFDQVLTSLIKFDRVLTNIFLSGKN